MKIQRFEKFINESIHENEIQDLTVVLNKTRKAKTALIEGLKKSIRSLIKEVYRWDIRDTLKDFTKWSDWKGEEMVIIDEKISRDIINFLYNGLDDFNNKQLSEIYVVLSTYLETNDNHCFDEFYDNLPQDFMNESNKNSNRKEGLLNQKVYQNCLKSYLNCLNDLLDEGFDYEDVQNFLINKIKDDCKDDISLHRPGFRYND